MSPTMLRQFWSLVDATRTNIPLALDDRSLVQWLLRQVRSERALDSRETDILHEYISSRLPLIRDLAQENHACYA
jgi:hypothetical protein